MCAYSLKINLPIHRNYSTDDWNIGKRKPNIKETCLLLYLSLFTFLSGISKFILHFSKLYLTHLENLFWLPLSYLAERSTNKGQTGLTKWTEKNQCKKNDEPATNYYKLISITSFHNNI